MTIEASAVIASVVAMIIEASAVIASVVAMIIEASAVIASVVAAASVVVGGVAVVAVGRLVAVAGFIDGFIVIGDVVIGSRFMGSIAWLAIKPMINCCCSIRSPFGYCSVVSCSALVSLVYFCCSCRYYCPYNIFTVSSTIPL